ncbi:cytochrome c oxidase subunit 2 [Roseimicrobium gellanilyticum]|uniref:cytochrome-c oxidase n=1 Tax=Roseimicrobium gellanilyticum TaxID=748857 RepID=A0A366HVI8_9BACT|nr:cytochrome c oxidase subunit II [Roseimicrobium gellanilyticum]RBP47505.1 cytochrome c oxidase subunit 2 [Roseimicrobium gellanilyticum]
MNLDPIVAAIPALNKILGIPELASEHGEMVDHMLELVHWFMLVLFIGWSTFLVFVFTKFRKDKSAKADYVGVRGHASTHIEIGVVIVEAILLLGFAFPLWAQQSVGYPTGKEVVKVRAMGEKFKWNFQYAGQDGTLGGYALANIGNPATNEMGLDAKDPNGKDDFVKGATLTLPVGRPVIIDVTSKDVIHNLALVPMRAAQDATPGVNGHLWFTPTKTGSWDIICGQLCGAGHSGMRGTLEVIPQKDFDEFMKEGSEGALKNAAAAPAAAPAAAH